MISNGEKVEMNILNTFWIYIILCEDEDFF